MQKNIATLAILLLLYGCSKKDSTPSGINIDGGTSGPSNTWLSTISAPTQADSTFTVIHFNSDHSVAQIIQTEYAFGAGYFGEDTTYITATLPVYQGGRLVSIETTPDTTAATGTVAAAFDYTTAGALQRIRYNPGTSSYTYDSVTTGAGGLLSASYHFALNTAGTAMTEQYFENYTWDGKKDLQSILVNNIDPSNGSVSSLTVTYTYDGFYNPYKTVKDLPFMFGQLGDIVPLLSASNPLGSTLVGYSSANNYSYQYNPNNLPASQNLQILQSGSIKQSTFVYFKYTN
ncbi:MAG TPA: hypothetical protein VL547_16280 [Dinghuibacter sp.]|uniref:hypothetical protein n=1 Tax=Dinghuibacter sp. TaxID=2024697 RepID=UPI002C98C966|nr:hypothetical protein [Dinghuibacter sp.]HTJ13595.1 hypothetical protein [Dinghuibacter sp.]